MALINTKVLIILIKVVTPTSTIKARKNKSSQKSTTTTTTASIFTRIYPLTPMQVTRISNSSKSKGRVFNSSNSNSSRKIMILNHNKDTLLSKIT